MAESNKRDDFKLIVSLLKKDKKISFITLSKELKMDFRQLNDLLSEVNRNNLIKIITPAIGSPYITIE